MKYLKAIAAALAQMQQRSKNKKAFFNDLIAAASDGKLTDEEIAQIQTRQSELGLTGNDLKRVRVQAYNAAFRTARADGKITAEEKRELDKLQSVLNIPDDEIIKSKQELARLRLLVELQDGSMPTIPVQGLILQKREAAHWIWHGNIIEERIVSSYYTGESSGVSIRIADGFTYRTSSFRGQKVNKRGVVPVSAGNVIITNKRIVFLGDPDSFSTNLDQLLGINLYGNGFRLTDNKRKSYTVQISDNFDPNIFNAILAAAIKKYKR